MPELAAQLNVHADLDLSDLFEALAADVLGIDFGDVRFDASGVLGAVAEAASFDLSGLRLTVADTLTNTSGNLAIGLSFPSLPQSLTDLAARIGSLQLIVPDIEVPDLVGLDGLGLRVDTVRAAVESGPLAHLLGLVPGLQWSRTLGQVSGTLGGLLDLLRVLAGLTAMATTSRQLAEQSKRLSVLFDVEAAAAAGEALSDLSGDLSLITAIRNAAPTDADAADILAVRVAGFLDAVLGVGDRWAAGMGYGEAALLGLDLTGTAAAIEVGRLSLTGVNMDSVATLCSDIHRAAAPILETPLPDPGAFADGFLASATELTAEVAEGVRSWDVAATLLPVSDLTSLVLGSVLQFQQALSAVGSEVTGSLRSLRGLVSEIELTPVVTAVEVALQPVVDVLDSVETEVTAAEATLGVVADNIGTALTEVSEVVSSAATRISTGLSSVHETLDALGLQALGETLSQALRTVASALSAAQLTPYFDTAIDVITTAADIIDNVPFGMLPTDIQQEIVDACRPIKELDLKQVEDALRGELWTIRNEFRADALSAIEGAYDDVVSFLTTLDPQPHLQEFESTTLGELRAMLDGIDPVALFEPVDSALAEVRGLLSGLDLEKEVLTPLRGAFSPILDAIDDLDPSTLLTPAREEIDLARTSILEVLNLDAAEEALTSFRELAAGFIDKVDAHALVGALDDRAVGAIAQLPAGPPGGAFGSILVSIAEASGFRADEAAVQDVIGWVQGDSVGGVVVRDRIQLASERVAAMLEAVASLDPAPLTAAASAYHRSLMSALAVHPSGSVLRDTLEPMLTGVRPDDVLATLPANRRRFQIALGVDAELVETLAASGRSEVTDSAAQLRAALAPLDAFPARLRELLTALGLDPAGRSLRQVLSDLLAEAVGGALPAALADLVVDAKAKVLEALELILQSGLDAIGSVGGVLALIDLGPVVDELIALHTQVRDEVAQLTPDALLADVISAGDAVIARLAQFDPLAPVRHVLTTSLDAADAVFESARPTVVFAPVVDLYLEVMQIAGGLDVVSLLRPVLDALDGIAGQLDDGFERSGDALQELQDALPSEVSSDDISASIDVGVSL